MKILITWMAYAIFMALIGVLLGRFRRSIDKTNQKDKENLVDKNDLVWVGLIISIVLVLIPLLLELAFYFMFISFHGDNVLNVTVVLAAIFFFIGAFLLCTKGALFGNLFTKTQFGMWTGAVLVGLPLTALSLFLFWYTVLLALFG